MVEHSLRVAVSDFEPAQNRIVDRAISEAAERWPLVVIGFGLIASGVWGAGLLYGACLLLNWAIT